MNIPNDLLLQIKDYLQIRYQELEIGLKYWREKKRDDKVQELRSSQAKALIILDRIRREVEKKNQAPQ